MVRQREVFPSGGEVAILRLLSGRTEKFGLQLVRESGGSIKRGGVYVTLQRMEDKGFVESREEEAPPTDVGLTRRLYRISATGIRALHAADMLRGGLVWEVPR